jgi:hypothetical protein
MPRAHISITRRSNTSELPPRNPINVERNRTSASRTWDTRIGIFPSAARIALSTYPLRQPH